MQQWSEPTSLRLLELIASTAVTEASDLAVTAHRDDRASSSSVDAEVSEVSAAKMRAADSQVSAVVAMLASLAESDLRFRDWLRARLESRDVQLGCKERTSTSVEGASSFNWSLITENWLAWLAAEPMSECSAELSTGGLEEAALQRCRLSQRAIVASARAALASRALVAERDKMRQELARELAYDMAYGLSHELNNPLANIAARARLLAEDEASEHKKQLLAAIVDQAMRGCEMIADLMLIARPPEREFEAVEFVSLVRETIVKARPWSEARGLSIVLHAHVATARVTSDRASLAEALWALLRNAIEVARREITLTISSSTPVSTGSMSAGAASAVTLSVQDDGPGITPHAQAHAFNPFFSGREAGRGLGVGLAKADRIARQSGGRVSIANAPERGCMASLTLPLSSE